MVWKIIENFGKRLRILLHCKAIPFIGIVDNILVEYDQSYLQI